MPIALFAALLLAPPGAAATADHNPIAIDRHALVARLAIHWNDATGRLALGNGEFCFGADGTGVQTFSGNSMAHWAWHSFPLPEGWTPERVQATGTFQQGRNTGGDVFDSFWMNGGAIDLSGSKDPSWKELERRVVLSQSLIAAMAAGSWPSFENGLLGLDSWRGQFHMEMVWWHLARYALWDRWSMADEALGCYRRFAPAARALAEQLGYQGLQWQKMVGPKGRTAPWGGNQVLLWKEPHPIFFAELEGASGKA